MAEIESEYGLLKRLGVNVLAASVDDEAGAQKMVQENSLSFPVTFGMTASDIAALDTWTGERQSSTYCQPAEFVLRPGGEVAASMYASTQLGRMKPREIIEFVKARM